MTKTVRQQQIEPPVESPAVITSLHTKNRSFLTEVPDGRGTKRVLSRKAAWRKLTPLQAAFAKKQLAGGSGSYSARTRYDAGQQYSETFDLAQSSGRDSTQALNTISSSGFGGGGISQAQSSAIKHLVVVDSLLGHRDRKIIRMVCGEGHSPVEAVRAVCGDYRDTVSARFREALDSLIEAQETARRHPGIFSISRETS